MKHVKSFTMAYFLASRLCKNRVHSSVLMKLLDKAQSPSPIPVKANFFVKQLFLSVEQSFAGSSTESADERSSRTE